MLYSKSMGCLTESLHCFSPVYFLLRKSYSRYSNYVVFNIFVNVLQWWSDESGNQKSTATAVDSKQVSSDQQTANSGRSTSLEIEIDEQKKQIWQLMTRERDMKHYIQMLQQQLEKRSSEAVVSAARLREVESNIQPSETPEPPAPPPPLQPQQLEDEPLYKRENAMLCGALCGKPCYACGIAPRSSVRPSVCPIPARNSRMKIRGKSTIDRQVATVKCQMSRSRDSISNRLSRS